MTTSLNRGGHYLCILMFKLLLVGSRAKLTSIGNIKPIQLYDCDVDIVRQYNYLGVVLDSEMTLRLFG